MIKSLLAADNAPGLFNSSDCVYVTLALFDVSADFAVSEVVACVFDKEAN